MKTRTGIFALVVVAAVGYCGLLAATSLSDLRAGEHLTATRPVNPELIAQGEYLAKLGDCAACHSVPGKPAFSGGLKMGIPIGAIYTTNITPDKTFGIGNFSLEDFDRALRFGVSKGHTLYPAMPFPSYANTRPEDVEALYAYFQHGVEAAAVPNRASDIRFPLSMRWPLTLWRWAFAPRPKPFVAAAGADPNVARGQYFVEGMGHCGECHTPRNLAMQVKAQDASAGDAFLSGAVVEQWLAPSLRNGGLDTLATWSVEDVEHFLKTGTNRSGIAFGSMSDVVIHSTQHLTPTDLHVTALFLKSLDGGKQQPAHYVYADDTDQALRSGDDTKRGARLYLDNCATCHRPDGRGYEAVFPSLAGNPVVQAGNPASLISIVMRGSETPRTAAAPAQFTMPGFAWRLSDEEAADVISFVRSCWGNDGDPVAAIEIKNVRRSLP